MRKLPVVLTSYRRVLPFIAVALFAFTGVASAAVHKPHRRGAARHARVAARHVRSNGSDPVLLGDTTLEATSDNNTSGQAQAWPYTATVTGTATDIQVYVNAGNAATRIGVGLYSSSSGHPGSRLTYASTTTIHAGAWNDITVPKVNVTAGTQYWLAILGTGGAAAFRDRASGTCATSGSQTSQTSMPATWNQAWQVTGYCPASIYLNGTVPATPPSNTTPPAISGTPTQGQTLTATQGSWSGTTPITYAYQWQDCAAGTCQNITGATSSTYTPVANDVGSTLDVVVTATNTAGSAHATSAVTQTVSAPNPDPGGQAMPTGDTAGWHQVFADNFAGDNVPVGSFSGCVENGSVITSHCSGLPTAVDQNWWAYPDGWSGTPNTGTYYPSKSLSIQNGFMDYFIHSETIGGVDTHIIDAPIPKDPAATGSWGGQVYGKYVVRAKLDSLPGYHASFLLWPDSNNWPNDGEIDWPEADFDQSITGAFMHWQNATAGSQQDAYTSNTAMASGWHTYEIDWTASAVSFYVDGTLVGKSTDPTKIPDTPMHWVLQVGNSFTEPTPADSTSGHVQVDWATIYQPTASAPANTTAPSISGTAQQGQTLTASPGSWTGTTPITYTYAWSDGATGQTDTLPASDVGQNVSVTVTATNSAGSAKATSQSVGPVTATPPPPPPPTGSFSIQGTKIIAPDGSMFIPVGANVNGQDSWWSDSMLGLSSYAQDWGMNTLRLTSCMSGGCPAAVTGCGSSCDYNQAPYLDNVISEYTAKHIVTMVELQDYTTGLDPSTQPTDLQKVINWWTAFAQKYKGNPYVWFNVLNEPLGINQGNPQQDFTDYKNLYGPIVQAIRNTGAQNIVVLDGAGSGQDSDDWSCSNSQYQTYSDNINVAPQLEAQYGNILPSVHVYNQWGGGTNQCSQASLEGAFSSYINAVHAAGVPLIVGETGDAPGCSAASDPQQPGQCSAAITAFDCAVPHGVGLIYWDAANALDWVVSDGGGIDGINSTTNPTNLSRFSGYSTPGGGQSLWDLGHGKTYSCSGP